LRTGTLTVVSAGPPEDAAGGGDGSRSRNGEANLIAAEAAEG
jgi:hypothetical protein